jgi:hypothetical protein
MGFGQWQREEAESTFALEAQGWAPFSKECVHVTGPVTLPLWQGYGGRFFIYWRSCTYSQLFKALGCSTPGKVMGPIRTFGKVMGPIVNGMWGKLLRGISRLRRRRRQYYGSRTATLRVPSQYSRRRAGDIIAQRNMIESEPAGKKR